MKILALVSAALLSAPATAQPAAVPAPAGAPQDAQRLALAHKVANALWPDGTYARMMKGSMDQMMDGVMASMMDLKPADMIPADLKPKDKAELSNASMRELMAKADPAFQERMRITNHVMMDEMGSIMARYEPELREGIAQAYARKFSAEQLADMDRFFATPTGRAYASDAMALMMDPEVMNRIVKAMPEVMQAMPRIMEKVEKATEHLPPPPKPAAMKH